MGSSGGEALVSYADHGAVFEDRAAMRMWLSAQVQTSFRHQLTSVSSLGRSA